MAGTTLTKDQIRTVQERLNARGIRGANGKPLTVDGVWGPNTSHAVRAFKVSQGLADRDYIGPVTWAKLTGDASGIKAAEPKQSDAPPWYNEMLAAIGLNEDRNNAALRLWLKSDGATVGDPAIYPWCGDALQTSMLRALPNEKMPENPYLALNWTRFGLSVEPQLGAVLSFWRGSPTSWQGHVGYYAGESASNFYVLGGNQADSISITPISKSRLRKDGSRWPLTGQRPAGNRVQMSGGTVSTNEA